MKTVGERIRQAREFRGLSGEELAKKVGYKTQSGISNLENRGSGHGGERLTKIARALNFSVEWFLTGPDTANMSHVKPFHTPIEPTPIAPSIAADQGKKDWGNPANRATVLLSQINDEGLLRAVEYLEMLAKNHPRNGHSAGVPVPARHARP